MTVGKDDDSTIDNAASLWRRVLPSQIVLDKNIGAYRPSSVAFNNSTDGSGMSVILGDQVLDEGRTPRNVMEQFPACFLASLTAKVFRDNSQIIFREPLDDEPAHCEVAGDKPKKMQRDFAKLATWIIPPDSPTDTPVLG